MELLIGLAIVIVVILIVVRAVKKEDEELKKSETFEAQQKKINDYANYFKRNCILTECEKSFYKVLKAKTDELGLTVSCKTRLEDLIGTNAIGSKYTSDRSRIKSRHVDFTILDENLKTIMCIELDDSSHYTQESQESDTFKDELFNKVGIRLYRVRVSSDFKEKVDKIFCNYV